MIRKKALVSLYTRPGCHLCEEAKEQMIAANCADLYEFEEINIESDPSLSARYRESIPVITINGVEAFKHRVSASAFRTWLSEMNKPSPTATDNMA